VDAGALDKATQDWLDSQRDREEEGDMQTPEDWQSALQGYDQDMQWLENLRNAKMEKFKQQLAPPPDPEYKFAEKNSFASNKSAFEEGVRLFNRGELKKSILAFEAAVTQNPEHAEAWRYLGQAQAENEEEANAIAALLKCISVDPYNLPALMMLGVSYTNDLEEAQALKYLRTWLENHPDYSGVVTEEAKVVVDEDHASLDGSALHDQVTKFFLDALKINSKDADLHTVLGVLYHISSDFDKAIESFKAALKLRPDDAQLWNKLGATQANSSRSAEAVHAYRRALQLRPGYVRVLANLAISFANQGQHENAARTYLATLKQNPEANHVWSYLRISLSHLGRDDLVELTQQRNVELFRPHYDF